MDKKTELVNELTAAVKTHGMTATKVLSSRPKASFGSLAFVEWTGDKWRSWSYNGGQKFAASCDEAVKTASADLKAVEAEVQKILNA
jgi:hypothetical protein